MNDAALVALICETTPEPPLRAFPVSDPEYPEILRRRIARRVRVDDNGCWVWQGSLNYKGYGMMGAFRRKGSYAHRVSYAVFIDETPIPEGWSIDHLCRNRACVNPFHLEAVPHAENVRRGETGITWRSRTHCANGHEFTPENTYDRGGTQGRGCRICRRERTERSRARLIEGPLREAESACLGPGASASQSDFSPREAGTAAAPLAAVPEISFAKQLEIWSAA